MTARAGGQRGLVVAEVQPRRRRHRRGRRASGSWSGSARRAARLKHTTATAPQHRTSGRSPRSRTALAAAVDAFATHGPRWPTSSWPRSVTGSCTAATASPSRRWSTTTLRRAVETLVPLAPLHNPANLEGLRGAPAAVPRRAAGGGLRHRLPPDDAARRLHLRRRRARGARSTGSAATGSTAPRTPSSAGRPRACSASAVDETNLDRPAPGQRRLGRGRPRRASRSTRRWGSRRWRAW